MLEPVSNQVSIATREEEILSFWERHGTFARQLALRKDRPAFIFYDGPPFATGLPHYGHLLAGTIKDIVPRYQAMRGYYVERRFGWDCHGLPIEALAQEQMGLAGAAAIVEKGVALFNETCRSMVLTYVAEWRKTVTRMGRWVDFDNDYKTMDVGFMESVWWVFQQLWQQGRVYKSHRIMPYSWKLSTPLSNFEAGRNYQEVQDPAITVRLRLKTFDPVLSMGDAPVYALIWTTTPWTLPGNLAICAGPDLEYVAVRDHADGVVYLLAESRIAAYYKDPDLYKIIKRYKGSELYGWSYEPLFPYFADASNSFRVLNAPFVGAEDGTGLVHIAPAFGEDDFNVGRAERLPLADYLDEGCAFTDRIPEYQGQFCKDADKAIIRRLKNEGKLVHQSTIVHSYPFCDRTDTPLIYRAIDAWYVRVEDLHEKLGANNETVHWVPDYVGGKRFGNWLREAKDWNVSRNRFWGSCIPVWVNEADKNDMICVGSIAELEALSGQSVADLHKHMVDPIVIRRDGKTYRRTPEVLDCWFESGAMPYAQQHYPFENVDRLERFFPAHFIAEGLDQTRGWFYTLMVLGTALFGRAPYRNVVVNGLVLAEDGRKMSKRLKNYPDPQHILNTYGADALRLYLIHSPVVRAEDLCFSEEGVKHSLRHLLIPWWNAYSFFVTYARIDGWTPAAGPGTRPDGLLDRWILSALDRLVMNVVAAMDGYDLQAAVRPFVQFVDDLTNWYIRRSRRRFWKSSNDDDKRQAYATLYEVLVTLSKVAAPFVPFMSESIYRNLRTPDMPESVHLCDFPLADRTRRDLALEQQMELVMRAVGMGRQLRADYNLKVRQPLKGLHVICRDDARRALLQSLRDLIEDELNVREVWFGRDESGLADLSAKPNFKTLGPKLGARIKKAAPMIQKLAAEQLADILEGRGVVLSVDGQAVELDPVDVIIERRPREGLAVATEGDLVVALDMTLTPELIHEGLARELVSRVQNMRKTMGLEVAQRIRLEVGANDALRTALEIHREYIVAETLCVALTLTQVSAGETWDVIDINDHTAYVRLTPLPA